MTLAKYNKPTTESAINQSEFKANTCNLWRARENRFKQVMIGFGFASHLLIKKVVQILLTNHLIFIIRQENTRGIIQVLLKGGPRPSYTALWPGGLWTTLQFTAPWPAAHLKAHGPTAHFAVHGPGIFFMATLI